MLTDELIAELSLAVSHELVSVARYLSDLPGDKTHLVLEVVRYVDRAFLSSLGRRDRETVDEHFSSLMTKYGYCPTLQSLLPLTTGSAVFGLTVSSPESKQWAGTVLTQVGRARFLQHLIDLTRSGILDVSQGIRTINFTRSREDYGVEILEHLERGRLEELRLRILGEDSISPVREPPNLAQAMYDSVFVWRDHYIGYEATPEVDDYFVCEVGRNFVEWADLAGVHPSFSFGLVTAADLMHVALAMASLHQKHVRFCLEYIRKFDDKDLSNIVTIWTEKQKLIEAISSRVGLSRFTVHQCLTLLAVTAGNIAEHANRTTPACPSLIEVTRRLWIRPAHSGFTNPLLFAAREMQQHKRKVWDKNVRKREWWFRHDLYALFQGDRFARVDESRQLRESNRVITDIDAAILDRETGTLALFELKWQEAFGDHEPERRSKAKNLNAEVQKWVKSVEAFLEIQGGKEIARQIGFSEDEASAIDDVKLFVIARFHARFSGFAVEHASAAVASWQQFTRVRLGCGSVVNIFALLFDEIRREQREPVAAVWNSISFRVGQREITVEEAFSQGPIVS